MIVDYSYYKEFELDLTGTCNLSCLLCTRNYAHAQHAVYKNIRPLKDITEQLDLFTSLEKAFVAGQVSEPTLHPEFLDYIRYLKGRNISVKIFSNGNTRDEIFWEQLGTILNKTDEMHFTVCGSTQELHEKYRVNSSLEQIMKNVKAYQRSNDNDFGQIIRFEYNKEDINNMLKMEFNNMYIVDSEGDRITNDKITDEDSLTRPLIKRDKLIKWVFDTEVVDYDIQCTSIRNKKIYISQSGGLYPCYMHNEYCPQDTSFNDEFNYTDILNFKHKHCFICDKRVRTKIDALKLDFVC